MTTTATDPAPAEPTPTDPAPAPTPTPAAPATPPAPTDPDADTAAELAKWKDLARKHEERAKANAAAAKELETFKASQMSDTEKAVAAAEAKGRLTATQEFGGKLAAASIRVAAAGRNIDVSALLKGVDPTRFLDDAGDPDEKAIKEWVDSIAPPPADPTVPTAPIRRDLGNGPRGGQAAPPTSQLERDLIAKLG